MTHAYPRGTVKSLVRTLLLDTAANALLLRDSYSFARPPRELEEAFITFENTRVARNRRSVTIGPKSAPLVITPKDTDGVFAARELVDESREGRSSEVITRISFVPARLEKEMTLQFDIR